MLGAANLGVEDSNGCQFLVTLAPAPHLAGTSTCFGKVLAGFGTLRQVRQPGGSVVMPWAGCGSKNPMLPPPQTPPSHPLDLTHPHISTRAACCRWKMLRQIRQHQTVYHCCQSPLLQQGSCRLAQT
jgi:cyclophilin family peptidyl-prolyl cis-trans isomerase